MIDLAYIRQSCESDLPDVFGVLNSNLNDFFPQDVINFFWSQWPRGQFVAVDPFGRVVGALCGSLPQPGRACIALLAVDGPSRGHGIGSQLIDAFRLECLMEGMNVVQLEVRVDNAPAIKFYQDRGFSISEVVHGLYNDGCDAYRMLSRTPSGRIISS